MYRTFGSARRGLAFGCGVRLTPDRYQWLQSPGKMAQQPDADIPDDSEVLLIRKDLRVEVGE